MFDNIRYVTNAAGERVAVILLIEEYEELLEDLHVTRVAYETRNDRCVPLADVIEELRAEGKLD